MSPKPAAGQSVAEARGLPAAAYTSEAFPRFERSQLFPRTWTRIAFAHEIPNPGDAMPVEAAGVPLILVRDQTGQIRALHNVCRHRASLVLLQRANALNALQCPYHAWTYGLDGRLQATPFFDGTKNATPSGLDKEHNELVPVACNTWNDGIFVNLSGAGPAFADHVGPLDQLFADFGLSKLRAGAQFVREFEANWKLVFDNW